MAVGSALQAEPAGTAIAGSKYVRGYCTVCGEAIRVSRAGGFCVCQDCSGGPRVRHDGERRVYTDPGGLTQRQRRTLEDESFARAFSEL